MLQIWTPLPNGAGCMVESIYWCSASIPIPNDLADFFHSLWRQQFAEFCLFVRTLPIDFALLVRKWKYVKSKTTAKLKGKQTSIAAVWAKLGQIDTFQTPHCRLPLTFTNLGSGWIAIIISIPVLVPSLSSLCKITPPQLVQNTKTTLHNILFSSFLVTHIQMLWRKWLKYCSAFFDATMNNMFDICCSIWITKMFKKLYVKYTWVCK